MVLHLSEIFKKKGIGSKALFRGQDASKSKESLSFWKTEVTEECKPLYPVLLIQTGEAASGLTLTEASKVFLMEPLNRVEEELQAHARCHRYGQSSDVKVVTLFTPSSVESRLLGLRAEVLRLESERLERERRLDSEREERNALVDSDDDDEEEEEEEVMDAEENDEDEGAIEGDEKIRVEARRALFVCGLINMI